jgi:(R,R)-butanediol dehydrogenase/meso-butanediol dehydrogenase/diacetyl reductase
MRALRFHGVGDVRVERVPVPAIAAAGEVRLMVRAAGICGSDLHNYRTGQWISRLPVTPGHEFCGEVIESDAAAFAPGDLVVADSRAFCGACAACLAGAKNLCASLGFVGEVCDGGFAEQTVLPGRYLYLAPAGVAPEIAAMAEPTAVALHAVRRLAPEKNAPILIVGGGPIGGLVALLLAQQGFGPLFAAERNPARAALLADLTGARIVRLEDDGLRAAGIRFCVDATGSAAALATLLGVVAPGGRVALVGLFHGTPALDVNRIVEAEIDVVGCSVFRDEMQDVLGMLGGLADKLLPAASAPIGLAEMPAAYARLIAGETTTLKTLVRP